MEKGGVLDIAVECQVGFVSLGQMLQDERLEGHGGEIAGLGENSDSVFVFVEVPARAYGSPVMS